MDKNPEEIRPSYTLPPDDNKIFEAILDEDALKCQQAIYNVLGKIQAPIRQTLLTFLENIDQMYGQFISDEEIKQMADIFYDEQGEEKFITAKEFSKMDTFFKNKESLFAKDEYNEYMSLKKNCWEKVSHFLNTTTDINNEIPMVYACVWGRTKAAAILKREGAQMPDYLLQKAIQWSDAQTVNWILNNGGNITPNDISTAKKYGKEDIFLKLMTTYQKTHPDYEFSEDIPKPQITQVQTETQVLSDNSRLGKIIGRRAKINGRG